MSDSDWTSTVGGVPKRNQGALPDGWYVCEVANAQMKDWESARGIGRSVKVEFRVVDGEERGRRFFASHIVKYESTIGEHGKAASAQRMGRQQYMDLVYAVGFDDRPDSLDALSQRACCVHVKHNAQRNELEVLGYRRRQ